MRERANLGKVANTLKAGKSPHMREPAKIIAVDTHLANKTSEAIIGT